MSVAVAGDMGAQENMDLDRELFEAYDRGGAVGYQGRVYGWQTPSVTLGLGQDPSMLREDLMAQSGVAWARRLTGGKAVLHDRELTYALAGGHPSPHFGSTLYDTYLAIGEALCAFLRELGLPAKMETHHNPGRAPDEICFDLTSIYEIEIDGRKIAGSAQKRSARAFLQHGSIPVWVRQDAITQYLRNPPAKLEKPMACLADFLPPPPLDELKKRLAFHLSRWES